ncbi:MAG: ATP-binding cassette domain-containing protein [Cyanobacteriota bacterium]|nr:ATP-binding cassette domain-containing protein [Cyanobacteriota bacterium]
MTNDKLLQLEQVSLAAPIGSSFILQDISFSLNSGDRVALVGASGSGKTTLLRLLNRLSDPTRGKITLENRPYAQIPPLSLRRQVALVPQEPKLLGMTVAEALAYPLVLQKFPSSEIKQRVQRECQRLKIPEQWRDRNELQLSLGQRQLCAIARSLVMEPKILLLDEPTSALDIGTATRVLQGLHDESDRIPTAILMVNHHLEQLESWCDRVLYLESGRLLENWARDRVNWDELRAAIAQLEAREALEWDAEEYNVK